MARRHLDNGWLGQYVSGAKRKVEQTNQKLRKATTGRSRGRYSLVDPSYLPEMIVTPNRNSYLTDELGNPAISMGALRDIGGNPIIKVNKQLRNNQPIYGITNKEASRRADNIVERTTPTAGTLFQAAIGKPMNLISPTHYIGTIRDWDKNKGLANIYEDNSGLTTKEYAKKHPIKAMLFNMLGDGLIGGSISGVKNGIRIGRNIANRNLFSYKYLDPAGYDNLWPRFKNWGYHILHDPSFKKGEIPEPVEVVASSRYKRDLMKANKSFAVFRDESFRKYLGLPERERLYIDNGDGTWRYNKHAVQRILERNGQLGNTITRPKYSIDYKAKKPYTTNDFITTSGGNVSIVPKSRTKINDELTEHIDDMYDVWDVTPGASYNNINEGLSGMISDAVRKGADNIYTKLYDNLYKHKFAYNNLGGSFLNKLRYGFDLKDYNRLNKLITRIGNKEVGVILGGKPFTMRTPMKYYIKTPSRPSEEIINKGTLYDYYRNLGEQEPLEFTYKYGGIHIDPANRGALTETMRRTGKTKYQLAHSKNPLTRKRARFAITAAKWNHG